jgi:hypothetical protein
MATFLFGIAAPREDTMSDKFWKLLQKIHDRMEACPNGLVRPRAKDCDPNKCAVYKYAFAAGRASALREAVEKILSIPPRKNFANLDSLIDGNDVLAALRALEAK